MDDEPGSSWTNITARAATFGAFRSRVHLSVEIEVLSQSIQTGINLLVDIHEQGDLLFAP